MYIYSVYKVNVCVGTIVFISIFIPIQFCEYLPIPKPKPKSIKWVFYPPIMGMFCRY